MATDHGITFEPGWPGMRYDVIPGTRDCETCRNTGYRIVHGAPRNTRTGQPHFDCPCECGRDPLKFLHDEVTRKTTQRMLTVNRSPADLAAALDAEFVIDHRAGGHPATREQVADFLDREMRRVRPIPAHLRADAPYTVCNQCGRKGWLYRPGAECGMPQPDTRICTGVFVDP